MADAIEAFRFPIAVDSDGRGELVKERDYARYVAQLIRQVLLTAPGERVNRPDFGAGLRRMVFAPIDDGTATLLQSTAFRNLDRWLGNLITIDDLRVRVADTTIFLDLTYTIKSRGEQKVLNLEVTA